MPTMNNAVSTSRRERASMMGSLGCGDHLMANDGVG
jgi:hypothetical protein